MRRFLNMRNADLIDFLKTKNGLKDFLLSALKQDFFYNEAHMNFPMMEHNGRFFHTGEVCPETRGFNFLERDCLFCFPSLVYEEKEKVLISLPKKNRIKQYNNLNFYGTFFETDEDDEIYLEDIFGGYLNLNNFPKGTKTKWINKLEDVYLNFVGVKVYHTV